MDILMYRKKHIQRNNANVLLKLVTLGYCNKMCTK